MSEDTPSGIDPGLLKLKLAINTIKLTDIYSKQAKCKLELLKNMSSVEVSHQRPHRFALRNFTAIVLFHLGEEAQAIEELEEILKEDSCNINALQDLATIYDGLYRKEDASNCLQRVNAEMKKIKDGNNDESRLAEARCLAGQALAWGFDLHEETKGTNRLENSRKLYEKALEVAGEAVGNEEREDWLYFLALDYVRLNNLKRKREDKVYYKESLMSAMKCLEPNLKSENSQRRSSAWCLLGNLFCQRPRDYAKFSKCIKKDHKFYWLHPEECYKESLKLNDQNCITLNQLAHLYFNEKREDEALDCLNKSRQLNQGASNHSAFRARAGIHLDKFNEQIKEKKKLEKQNQQEPDVTKHVEVKTPDKNLLRLAMDDLQLCIKYNPYVLDMINLAEVYHKMAWKDSCDYERSGLHRALLLCLQAEKCQDGAMRSDLHQRRALILQDLGDAENAIQCFMQAMDFENPGTKYNRNFVYMFNSLLKRYSKSETKPNHLLQQLVYWLEEGLQKYCNTIKVNQFVRRYPEEMMSIMEVLSRGEKRKQLDLAKQCVLAFKSKIVSCDQTKLDVIEQQVTKGIESCTDQKEKPQSPHTKAVMKAKMKDLTLKTSPVKEKKFFDSASPTYAAAKAKLEASPIEQNDIQDSTESQLMDNADTETAGPSTEPGMFATTSQSPQNPLPVAQCPKVTSVQSHTLSIESPLAQQNPNEMDSPQADVQAVEDEVFSPSQIPPISPNDNPLARYAKSMCTVNSAKSSPCERLSSSEIQELSSVTSPWTPQSISVDSVLSTPSTADSLTFELYLKTPNKGIKKSFTFPVDKVHHRDLVDVVRRTMEESDLCLPDIGEPPPTALHHDFKYDFYAVYDPKCEKTSNFVYYHLRSQLEEGTRPLKGCIQERDFILGKPIIDSMEIAVEESAKILLLISTGFFQNGWCKQATNLALGPDVSHKVVPILLDHERLPRKLSNIQYHDATNTINWALIRRNLEPPSSPSLH